MTERSSEAHSQLYLLRIWADLRTEDTLVLRGKLQPVPGGDSYCFADACELCAILHTLLAHVPPPVAEPTPAPTE